MTQWLRLTVGLLSRIFLPTQTTGKTSRTPPTMMDRLTVLDRDVFNAHYQIHQTNTKRTTLTRNSTTCLMVPSFLWLGESIIKLLAKTHRFVNEIGCGGGLSLIDNPKHIQLGRREGFDKPSGTCTHHVRCQAVSPDPRELQAFSGFGFILCSPVPPEQNRDNVWQDAGIRVHACPHVVIS